MNKRVEIVKNWTQQYGKNLGLSLLIHVLLLSFLLLSVETTFDANQLPTKQGEIIQAVVVSQQKVEEEVKRIQNEEIQHKVAEEQQQKQLTQKLEQVKKEREQEQAKLEQLKQDMAKAKEAEQERLADIKLAKEKEQKQLEALKSQKAAEQKRIAALDDQRQAEQDRVKDMKAQREKEEKKKQKDLLAKQQAEAKRQAALNAAKEGERLAAENQRVMSEVQKVLMAWRDKIQSNKRQADSMADDLLCKLDIIVLPDGNVQVKLAQSSGNPAYDDLSMKAVYKSQPFPLPEDDAVKEQVKSFTLGLRNKDEV